MKARFQPRHYEDSSEAVTLSNPVVLVPFEKDKVYWQVDLDSWTAVNGIAKLFSPIHKDRRILETVGPDFDLATYITERHRMEPGSIAVYANYDQYGHFGASVFETRDDVEDLAQLISEISNS